MLIFVSVYLWVCLLIGNFLPFSAGTFSVLRDRGWDESHSPATNPQHPNIVIILTDDQGWGDLSINGNTNLHTPHIDQLGKKGAVFNHFYVSPVCSPTRAELLTGRYHPRSGVSGTSAGDERMDLDERTIAGIFGKAGYRTAAFGKWHSGMQYPYHPNARGFDEFYGFCSGHWGNYFNPLLEHNGEIVRGKGFIADDLTEKAMNFIRENKDHPFFVYLPYNTPHSPMQVPDKWWNKFRDKELQMRHRDAEKEDVNFTRAALAMCENIDWNVGRVMEQLKALHLEENTIVLYFSDNGPNSWRWNGGMKGRKGSTDEGGVRSPLMIRWPGKIGAGKQIDQIAGAIDLLPTLADLAGISMDAGKPLDGISLKPLLLKKKPVWPERLIFSYWKGRASVRSQRYRLDDQGGLFDMEQDPGQDQDIAKQEPALAAKMRARVESWKEEMEAELAGSGNRPFSLGHPGARYTYLPARDGIAHGTIERSNRFPNSSFFTNWTNVGDAVTWDVEVVSGGDFEVVLYYTCPEGDTGATFELSLGKSSITGKVTESYDPPLQGMEHDRVERMESYVKDFRPLKIGIIHLEKGRGQLTLKALSIPGRQAMDLSLLTFARIE